MDLVKEYLGLGFFYGIIAGVVICHLMLLGYLLWYKQWMYFFLTLFFDIPCAFTGFGLGVGALIPLVVGWQEAKNWNIKKLMWIYSVLVLFSFFILSHHLFLEFTTPKEQVDPRLKKMMKGGAIPGKAGAQGKMPQTGLPKPR